jgi:hypothetical protein
LDVWDWAVGDNFPLRMNAALERADRVLALWSAAYFEPHRFASDEWTSEMAKHPDARRPPRLVPVRIERVDPPSLLRPLIYQDLFGRSEAHARATLLAALSGPSVRGQQQVFPGDLETDGDLFGPKVPGTIPRVWNVRRRNPAFTGRQALLAALRERLASGERAFVQSLNGMGGVGKTQLAIEYAHLFAGEYDLVWWIDAEHPELIGEQISRLSHTAGWADAAESVAAARERVWNQLRHAPQWLLIYDNVRDPDDVENWLPQGCGHVIITARQRGFTGMAAPFEIPPFTRAESVDLLQDHLPKLGCQEAESLATALVDLPLAVAQAAGLLAKTAMTVPEYLQELTERTREILSEGRPTGYPVSFAAGVEIAWTQLADREPAAVDLLHLAAVLAPEPIPLAWLRNGRRPLDLRRTLAALSELGLASVTEDTVQVHRLTQAVLRDQWPEQLPADRSHAARLLVDAQPGDGSDSASWPDWAALMPHLLTLEPTAPRDFRALACDAVWYLLMRGEYHVALSHAESWYLRWWRIEKPDDDHLLRVAALLARALLVLGRYQEAYDLDLQTWDTRHRELGPEHPDTLASAGNLAEDLRALGRYQEAYDLNRQTLGSRVRMLGPEHPDTLASAGNLAADLRALGRYQEGYDLDRQTLGAYLRLLGSEHATALSLAGNLAEDLRALGRHQEAYDLDRHTLRSRVRMLGPEHPDTLASAGNLAADLRALGRYRGAYGLDRLTLQSRRRILGPEHPVTLASAGNLGKDLRALRRYQEAYDLDQQTLHTRHRVLGPEHPATLSSANNLASTLRALGRYQEAYDLDRQTLETRRRVLEPGHPATLASADKLKLAHRRLPP